MKASKKPALGLAAAAALLAGCALARKFPAPSPAEEIGLQYYSDLGPSEIDVSAYPPEQRKNYEVYKSVCSRCHGLARSISSPVVSREFWEMYVQAMRRRSRYGPVPPINDQETAAILDFLDYDAQTRKIGRKAEFDAQTRELKRRYAQLLDESLREKPSPRR